MLRELFRVGKRQRNPEMPGRRLGQFLTGRADRRDLEFRKRLKSRDVSNRGKSPVRTGPDNSHADLAARRHDIPLSIGSTVPTRPDPIGARARKFRRRCGSEKRREARGGSHPSPRHAARGVTPERSSMLRSCSHRDRGHTPRMHGEPTRAGRRHPRPRRQPRGQPYGTRRPRPGSVRKS